MIFRHRAPVPCEYWPTCMNLVCSRKRWCWLPAARRARSPGIASGLPMYEMPTAMRRATRGRGRSACARIGERNSPFRGHVQGGRGSGRHQRLRLAGEQSICGDSSGSGRLEHASTQRAVEASSRAPALGTPDQRIYSLSISSGSHGSRSGAVERRGWRRTLKVCVGWDQGGQFVVLGSGRPGAPRYA